MKVDMTDDEFRTTLKESHRVFRKYQMNIHHDEPSDCDFEKVGLYIQTNTYCTHRHDEPRNIF